MEREGRFSNLRLFFSLFSDQSSAVLRKEFFATTNAADMQGSREKLRSLYEQAVTIVEDRAAAEGFPDRLISLQQGLYRELEDMLFAECNEERHRFLVVIPVADRPQMLRKCLQSLIRQCRLFGYGGTGENPGGKPLWRKISLLVFDDSREEENRDAIRELTAEASAEGIEGRYVGLQGQAAFLRRLTPGSRERLSGLIGTYNGAVPPHKGASLTRNMAYLYIKAMLDGDTPFSPTDRFGPDEEVLVYFIDSDEEFGVLVREGTSAREVPFINYFYRLDKIFRSAEIEVLTGKVVGDPPVTPAVMINTFLDDLNLFFASLPDGGMNKECPFHESHRTEAFSAEYHDLGKLFGYRQASSPKKYRCDLAGPHTVRDCLDHLSARATEFFHGLHPTRGQYYHHAGDLAKTEAARTVYTGNYVFSRAGLRHFIPFASLGLRMAGPTLGRMLKSQVKERFVSANLPLLHKRTMPGEGAEFRSGVLNSEESVDLSMECYRQFWGDVMLFSVESLAPAGYPVITPDRDTIASTVRRRQEELWQMYREKFSETDRRIAQLRHHLSVSDRQRELPGTDAALKRFDQFSDLAESNFATKSEGFRKLTDEIAKGEMLNRIIDAIRRYREDEDAWHTAMGELAAPSKAEPENNK
jgi:hypothetical protein